MKNILKKMALLAIPVVLWFVFFAAFEPNNYFGLKASASSSQPVARVRAYQQAPGTNLILGDSRLAHFDMRGRTLRSAVPRSRRRLIWRTIYSTPVMRSIPCWRRFRSIR